MNHTDQARFMWKWANKRGSVGVHTFELRERHVLNPSQRSKDVADHVPFWTKRDGRGSRYWTDGNQPSDATPVRPNGTEGGGGTAISPAGDSPAPLSVEAASEQVGVKVPVAICKDFTTPGSDWVEIPLTELEDWAA